MRGRRRHLFVLLFVLGLIARLGARHRHQADPKLGLDLKGGLQLVYQGEPTGQVNDGQRRRHRTARSKSSASGSTSSASPSPKSRDSEPARSRSACPTSPTPARRSNRSGRTAQLYFYDWEPNLIGPEQDDRRPPGPATAVRRL